MNVIGILKIHDPELTCSRNLDDLFLGPNVEQTDLEQIISYLRQGIPMFKFMSSVDDADGKSMGQLMYLTDGEWIWPSYYVYYLEKYPNIIVPKIFLDHVGAKKNVGEISIEERYYAEYMTCLLLRVTVPKNLKSLQKIQHLIEARGEELICY